MWEMMSFIRTLFPSSSRTPRLHASEFIAGNKAQLEDLKRMGIRLITMKDGRVQLLHTATDAASSDDAEDGLLFMQEMIEISKAQEQPQAQQEPRSVQLISAPFFGGIHLPAGPAQFGLELMSSDGVYGQVIVGDPYSGCSEFSNAKDVRGKIVVVERGMCLFIDKARKIQEAGGIGGIVIDNNPDSSSASSLLFAMSGDGKRDITIPMVFLFSYEGKKLLDAIKQTPNLQVLLSHQPKPQETVVQEMLGKQSRHAHIPQGSKVEDKSVPEKSLDGELKHPAERITTINLGGVQIKVKTREVPEKEVTGSGDDSILRIKKTVNNDRNVYVDLEKMVQRSKDANFADLSKELMGILQGEVLDMGANNDDYFNAVKSMIEAALATMPVIRTSDGKETPSSDTSGGKETPASDGSGSDSKPRQHYATEKELQEDRVVRPEDGGAWVREARDEQNLKDGEFIVENGVMYIPREKGEGKTQEEINNKKNIHVDDKTVGDKTVQWMPKAPGVVGGQVLSQDKDNTDSQSASERTSSKQRHINGDHVNSDNKLNKRTGDSTDESDNNQRSNSKDEL